MIKLKGFESNNNYIALTERNFVTNEHITNHEVVSGWEEEKSGLGGFYLFGFFGGLCVCSKHSKFPG